MSRLPVRAASLALALAALTTSPEASAIPRSEVMARAKAFAFHPWTCTAENLTAACAPAYQSVYVPGDYVGLPYDWGGYMTLFEFDQQIDQGYGAGSYPDDGILACTSGVDCSGFVSKAWGTGHYTTSNLADVSSAIVQADLLPGDVFNDAGYHVAMFDRLLASGEPVLYESINYNVHVNVSGGWSHVSGYIPRRFTEISGASAPDVAGTPVSPIVIGSFPYTDSRDTTQSPSDLLDGCGAAPSTKETGREFVYEATFAQPGKLTVSIADDVGVDIDGPVYPSMHPRACFARAPPPGTVDVDCGTYYVVADTFKGQAEYPGAYTLTATFQPSGQACGNGPPAYAPEGQLGDACAYPSNEDLPFCNPNVGAETCLYSGNDSFCSKPCASASDCSALPGGCCADIGDQELYCLPGSYCGAPTDLDAGALPEGGDPLPDGGLPDPEDAGGPGPTGGGGAGASGATTGAGAGAGADTSGNGAVTGDGDAESGCAQAPGSTAPPGAWLAGSLVLAWASRRRALRSRARSR